MCRSTADRRLHGLTVITQSGEQNSHRIPRVVKDSLNEADRCIQAGASIAACAMLGRALEALCSDILGPALKPAGSTTTETPSAKPKEIMLGEGIKRLHEEKVIDDRLFDWSQQLHAFRNLAAHAEDTSISKDDAGLCGRSAVMENALLSHLPPHKPYFVCANQTVVRENRRHC